MKTTTTKLSVLAFLGLGLVVYGQDYSGKVGINYNKPNATLEIKGKSDNTDKTLEGLIIPNVSKNKAYLMTTNTEMPLKESTLIYVDNISDYTISPVDTKVADITEKGYYFWNGTKWVKSAGSANGNTDLPWFFNTDGNVQLNYPKSGILDKYTEKQHIYRDVDVTTYNGYLRRNNLLVKSVDTIDPDFNTRNFSALKLSKVPNISQTNEAQFYRGWSIIDSSTPSNVKTVFNNRTTLLIDGDNTNSYTRVADYFSMAENHGAGVVSNLMGNASIAFTFPNSTTNKSWGVAGFTATFSNNNSDWLIGIEGYASQRGRGTITELVGVRGLVGALESTGIGNITNAIALKSDFLFPTSYTGQVSNVKGVQISDNDIASTVKITDMYGLYIENVNKGSNLNYAIYTNAGKVHFGDEVNVAGSITATSIKGSNGTTIFPDYVFQKYYTGTSSLKADYNFKTLSQVEDFVKTNGHLPGYQSATEIKKQGYIDLMATQLTNVEKIEELYLHSIEQDKALKAKDAEIKELKERLSKIEALLSK
ncbi:hypothetical protein [Riemerella anatipestifer]|uniref:hypothetical protein n=1 Tax=Riemerella anatipestifer TaxID=34085 RepID=UPI0030EC046D